MPQNPIFVDTKNPELAVGSRLRRNYRPTPNGYGCSTQKSD